MPVDSKSVKAKPKTKATSKKPVRAVSPNSKGFFDDQGTLPKQKKGGK